MIMFLDTETTSLRPGQIAQIAYLLEDERGVRAKNFWFSVEEMDAASGAVNGLSVGLLASLSGGRRIAEDLDEILSDLAACSAVCGHNAAFDLGFLRAECDRANRMFVQTEILDTMTEFTPVCKLCRGGHPGWKYPKLSELTRFMGLDEAEIARECGGFFGEDAAFHDARYDVTAVYLSVVRSAACAPRVYETYRRCQGRSS